MVAALLYPSIQEPVPLDMGAAETVTLDKWHRPLDTPPKLRERRRVPEFPAFAYGPRYNFNPAQQIDWHRPLSEPPKHLVARRAPEFPALAYGPRYDFNPVQMVSWHRPLNEPPKPKTSILAGQQQAFAYGPRYDFDPSAQIGWHRPLSVPSQYLFPRRVPEFPFLALHNIAPTFAGQDQIGWYRPFFDNIPPRPKVSIQTGQHQHFAYEAFRPTPDVTLDEWWEPLRQPQSLVTARRVAEFPAFSFVRVVPMPGEEQAARWFRQLEEPPQFKAPRRLMTALQRPFFMTLHYPRLPVAYLEGYDLTLTLTGLDGRVAKLEGYSSQEIDLVGLDARQVYLEGYKADSDLG